MRAKLNEAGLEKSVFVDSAGTLDYHIGKLPDHRMVAAAASCGVRLEHRARQFQAADLGDFDLILAMDRNNLADIKSLDPGARFSGKIKLFGEFCTIHKVTEIPDPYTGGPEDFELVLDLLDDGCAELVRRIQAKTLLSS